MRATMTIVIETLYCRLTKCCFGSNCGGGEVPRDIVGEGYWIEKCQRNAICNTHPLASQILMGFSPAEEKETNTSCFLTV